MITLLSAVFVPPQTLIRYILMQNLSSSLEDSLKLADTYKLPTSQIHYLYLMELIAQGKVWPWQVKHIGTNNQETC